MVAVKIKVHIDQNTCLAYGDCAELAPEAFEVDDVAHLVGPASGFAHRLYPLKFAAAAVT